MKNIILLGAACILGAQTVAAGFSLKPRPPVVNILARDASAAEATADPGRFVIHRNTPSGRPLRVFFHIGGTALNGVDFETIPNSAVIPAFRTSVAVSVRPLNDTLAEGRENVVIRLAPRRAYRVGLQSFAKVHITDDEPVEQSHFTLGPTASGTIAFRPEAEGHWILSDADLYSAYTFFPAAGTREFRRAILEFQLPDITRHVVSARLHLTDSAATTDWPLPITVHQVHFYPADLQLTTNDYDLPGTFAWAFDTDTRINEEHIQMDLTRPVRELVSANQDLGLRIKLAADPDISGESQIASANFQSIYQGFPPRLVIRTTQRPMITLTPRSPDAFLQAPAHITIDAALQDQDGYVRHIDFYANGEWIGGQYLDPPENSGPQYISFQWSNVVAGNYVITAVAADNRGAETLSNPVTFIVCPETSVLIPTYGTVLQYQYDGHHDVFTGDIHAGATRDDVRQGFIEFAVPTFSEAEPLLSASLVMINNSGIPNPIPGQTQYYEVSYYTNYAGADLMIATNDWDNPVIAFSQFAPQLPDSGERIIIDITALVQQYQDTSLGFRVSGLEAEAKWFKDVAILITTDCRNNTPVPAKPE